MRGIILRCNKYEYRDYLKSSRPVGIEKIKSKSTNKSFNDVVLILLCIEKDDKDSYLDLIVKRVDSLNTKYYKLKNAAVAPFVHLSRDIEKNPAKSLRLCKSLSSKLRKIGFKVHTVTFGTHKSSLIDFPGKPYSVSYFEFPN